MTKFFRGAGYAVLSVGHVAGMIDMVALPLWISALIKHYAFSPAQAGGVVTMFLLGVVAASALVAPQFARLPHRICVAAGYLAAAACFLAICRTPVDAIGFPAMAALHALAGLCSGGALSITHGVIGRTANPHRLFGVVNTALGVVGVLTFAGLPTLIDHFGPQALFLYFASIMGAAGLACAAGFPQSREPRVKDAPRQSRVRLPATAWLIIFVVICMTFNQAMLFSFLQQLGVAHGFGEANVDGVLIALGFVNLFPGAVAAITQRRFAPIMVGFAGPTAQAAVALTLSFATAFAPFAVAGSMLVSTVIFTHVFLFGLLSRIDASGRSVAGTPAMMMIGSCTGPAVGGLIVSTVGYQGLGVMAAGVSTVALVLVALLRLQLQARPASLAPVGV